MGACVSSAAPASAAAPEPVKTSKSGNILETSGDVYSKYRFDKILGKGNFGIVHQVYDLKTGESLACKSISKRKLVTPEDAEDVRREVQIMLHLAGHPNIVQLKAVFEDKQNIHLVMEVCTGGELFDRVAERGRYTEKDAAEVMRDVVSVVNHCHLMNVIHRDLKPENFLLSDKQQTALLKATDFGLSRFFKGEEVLDEIVGSPFYVAPEVLRRHYGKEADIWSCGVMLYILLCGWPPYHGDSTQQIFRSILSAPLDLKSGPWPKISDSAKDLVKRMLQKDPRRRATADEVLKHPWLAVHGVATDHAVVPEVLIRMRQFAGMNKLKKEALKVIAKSLPSAEVAGIQQIFQEMDEDQSGMITVEELKEGLKRKGAILNADEVQRIVNEIDVNGNQLIDYEEFIAATMHLSKLNREENMITAFKYFDTDNSGYITHEELAAGLSHIGEHLDIDGIIRAIDVNNDGKIDYEEFCVMMRRNDLDVLTEAANAMKSKMIVKPEFSQSFALKQNDQVLE